MGDIIIPEKVAEEIRNLKAYGFDLQLFENARWITVRQPANKHLLEKLLKDLDAGEAEAIALSRELRADYLIIDERLGRDFAQKYNIRTTGLLGILLKAKQKGLVAKIRPIVDELKTIAGFWISDGLYEEICKQANEN